MIKFATHLVVAYRVSVNAPLEDDYELLKNIYKICDSFEATISTKRQTRNNFYKCEFMLTFFIIYIFLSSCSSNLRVSILFFFFIFGF